MRTVIAIIDELDPYCSPVLTLTKEMLRVVGDLVETLAAFLALVPDPVRPMLSIVVVMEIRFRGV